MLGGINPAVVADERRLLSLLSLMGGQTPPSRLFVMVRMTLQTAGLFQAHPRAVLVCWGGAWQKDASVPRELSQSLAVLF